MALPNGPISTFHPNGELASRAEYVDGLLEGRLLRFATSDGSGEPLRPCCVPPGARELRADYRHGQLLNETFFDLEGRPLCGDGTPWPEPPAGIPEAARYDESSRRFYEELERASGERTTRYFDPRGKVSEELDLTGGRLVGRRRFAPDGSCLEAWELDGHGVRHGTAVRRFPGETSPYADARIREEYGHFAQGERAAELRLCDADGTELARVQLGQPLPKEGGAEVLDELGHTAAEAAWKHAEGLHAEGRAREAVALATRALGRDGDVARFASFLERTSARLRPEAATELSHAAASEKDTTPSRLLAALLCGAAPTLVLRTLAATVHPAAPAALDYAEAALRLAPDDPLTLMLRGLARLERGDREGALADARTLAPRSLSAANLLEEHCRCVFAAFGFAPQEQPVQAGSDELLAVGFEQSLEAAQRAVRLYATRIAEVRAALVAKVGDVPWLPPDTTELLAEGRVPLASYTARIEEETDAGVEVVEVPVDETLPNAESSVRRLMTTARADWAALSWLCWSVGLDRVAMPSGIAAPALFAEAANRATLRCFWAHDRLRTEGLVAAARHLPKFSWEGLPIESMPRELVEIAAAEYLEVRAQFLWALFPENVSPFQADLRKV